MQSTPPRFDLGGQLLKVGRVTAEFLRVALHDRAGRDGLAMEHPVDRIDEAGACFFASRDAKRYRTGFGQACFE
jgi:hypothetical protein